MKTYILLIITLFSCSPEDVKKLSPELEIGQEYNNGVIFYIFDENSYEYVEGEVHGYIVSSNLGEFSWGCQDIPLHQFTAQGYYNTQTIISFCGANNASGEANGLGWWLPSYEEWELLIASNAFPRHTFTTYYWSSTKATYEEAYCFRPSDGNIEAKHVNTLLKTWGIKQF